MSLTAHNPVQQASPPPPRGPRRGGTALLVAAALAGGALGAAGLAAVGAIGGGSSSTTVVQRASGGGDAGTTATGLDAAAIYRGAAAGTVDITSRGITTSQPQGNGPFPQPQSGSSAATGSGFVLDSAGRIVTAAHVVDGASSITVKLQDGTSRTAKVLGTDNATDVAVLKIDPSGLKLHPLTIGSSAALGVGDSVAAIGDPFTYDRSISTGIVSGLDRTIEAPNGFTVAHAIQTDASLNPGNSGGPLLDSRGHVIGVVDQIATDGSSEQSSGVGFAVPIDLIAKELPQLVKGQAVKHAYLGVSTSTAPGTAKGAVVGDITAGSPAAAAGLKAGDVITALDGEPVAGTSDLVAAIATHTPGDTVTLTVDRGGSTQQITAKLGTQPTQRTTTG